MPNAYFCKQCGYTQRGDDCDEMYCNNCRRCDWSPRGDIPDEEIAAANRQMLEEEASGKRLPADVVSLLGVFREEFEEDFRRARACGAISGDESDVEVARMVLQTVARKFWPVHRKNRATLANLKKFI